MYPNVIFPTSSCSAGRLLSTSQLWGEQMSLTPNEIIERSRRLIEDADVIRAGLNARKTSADGIRAYVHETADAAIARADLAKVRALDAANTAPNNRAGAEQRYEEAREIVENARMLSDREEGHSVAEKKDEWKECRITIDRFDKLLVDLRKTGTGFITALIGASALFLPKTLPPKLRQLACRRCRITCGSSFRSSPPSSS